jgi:TatD DNase family protein
MSYPLIDIGANLTHDSFDEDRSEMMQRAIDAGVTRIIVTGASDEGNVAAAALAAANPGHLYATAGVHPHHASDYGPSSDDPNSRLRPIQVSPYSFTNVTLTMISWSYSSLCCPKFPGL